MSWFRLAIVSAILLLATAVVWLARPHSRPNTALVEPRLTGLREPFLDVATCHYMDGGSIGIEITDADGRQEEFAIPCYLGSSERYERVLVGARHEKYDVGATPVANSLETKQYLIWILARYSRNDPYMDADLAYLSRRPMDFARVLIHRFMGHFDPDSDHLRVE